MFARFASSISQLLPSGPSEQDLEQFVLEQDSRTRVCYAPFDHVNTSAKIIILGITPGRDSMMNAFRAATAALQSGATYDDALRIAKRAGSFSNMRDKLASMLDGIGLHSALGLTSCADLFSTRCDLVHTTSCIRNPVFVWNSKEGVWSNYTGHQPKLGRWSTARSYIERLLLPELQSVPSALIIPCGEVVTAVLRDLAKRHLVDQERCLFGFPHASGANGHCDTYYAVRRTELSVKVRQWASSPCVVSTEARMFTPARE